MAELISFVVPNQSDKVLLVWELSAGPPAEALSHSLFTVFSQFGLLYSVRVFPNAAVARPGFYAIIKFYSSRDAQRAQKACDGKPLFQTSPVKIRLGTRHKALRHQAFALNSSRCQELANYYFGFNGWSKRIVKLQELSGLEDAALAVPLQKRNPQFFCAVEVVLPSYECRSPGVGISEEPQHQLEEANTEPSSASVRNPSVWLDTGQSSFLTKRKTAQKLAFQAALSDAFQKLSILVLESGKIAVEYRPTEEDLDAGSEEELQNLIQDTGMCGCVHMSGDALRSQHQIH
ncbi:RAD52 motif-containing protein 1 isoform X2 [Grammomys surdaster]|uniref:RAD52 motif-containing protein 1 isoform X2 n=1 Tax=Grammomys surdaster TaxID=491861 RepID=UPI0010A04EA1|nr:RAD52 motif-containing protein 1 isoform X2 [Grammomys surdaster]